MPKESNLELKVGLFVIVGILLVTFFVFSVGGSSFIKNAKVVKVVFEFANGLKKNAPVRIAGVDKGIVKKIDLFFDIKDRKTKANVDLIIAADVQIPNDSVFMINQLGLMGEKYLEIIPGLDTENFYEEGQVVIGKDPIAQEILAERVMDVANQLEESILGVNQVIGDDERMENIGKTIDNLNSMTLKLDEIMAALQDGSGTIGKLLVEDDLYENLEGLTSDLNDILNNLKEGRGTVGKFLADDGLYTNLEELSSDLKDNPWKLLRRSKGPKKR